MDTLGNLIDKQLTTTMKIKNTCQADKILNLSDQLGRLSNEIDCMAKMVLTGEMCPEDSMRPQHKTY